MYYGYVPTGTTAAMMRSGNPYQRIAGEDLAYQHATSDRGLMNREQNRKGYDSETMRFESQNKFAPGGLLSNLISKVKM